MGLPGDKDDIFDEPKEGGGEREGEKIVI